MKWKFQNAYYSSWLDQKDKRLATEEKGESKRRKQLQRELEWVKMSPKGRHAKNKARIGAYEKMLNQEQDTGIRQKLYLSLINS